MHRMPSTLVLAGPLLLFNMMHIYEKQASLG